MSLHKLIAVALVRLRWSQTDLARATGISRCHLSPMLRGARPIRIRHLLLIDHALGLNLDYNACVMRGDVLEGTK